MPIEGVNGPANADSANGVRPSGNPFNANVETQAQFEQALGQAFAQVIAPMVQMIMANTGE